jgi:hypothetical protein
VGHACERVDGAAAADGGRDARGRNERVVAQQPRKRFRAELLVVEFVQFQFLRGELRRVFVEQLSRWGSESRSVAADRANNRKEKARMTRAESNERVIEDTSSCYSVVPRIQNCATR